MPKVVITAIAGTPQIFQAAVPTNRRVLASASALPADDAKVEETPDPFAKPQGVITSVNAGEDDGEVPFALALLRPQAAKIGVRVRAGAACGAVVDLPFATRFREGLHSYCQRVA